MKYLFVGLCAALALIAMSCQENDSMSSDDGSIPTILNNDRRGIEAAPVIPIDLNVELAAVPDSCDFSEQAFCMVQLLSLVTDLYDVPMPGVTVYFYAQRGEMEPAALTNSSGIAQVTLHLSADVTFPNPLIPEIAMEVMACVCSSCDSQLIILRR